MTTVLCWHRAGRTIGHTVTCRHCGVAIEYCPCVGPHFRSVDTDCDLFNGSMWIAIVRGAAEKFLEYFDRDDTAAAAIAPPAPDRPATLPAPAPPRTIVLPDADGLYPRGTRLADVPPDHRGMPLARYVHRSLFIWSQPNMTPEQIRAHREEFERTHPIWTPRASYGWRGIVAPRTPFIGDRDDR